MDLGFRRAGFDVCVAIEQDSSCCETLRRNNPGLKVIQKPIQEVSSREIMHAAGIETLDLALVIGGPPCQPFSLAGDRLGLEDPRASCLGEFVRVVRDLLPRAFVMENVRGLLNWNGGQARDLVMRELRKPIAHKGRRIQYEVGYSVLDAADHGVPQHRERVFFVGDRMGKGFSFPLPGPGEPPTVWDAIGGLPAPDGPSEAARRVSGTIRERIKRHGF